jgi:hypothetical protein
MAKYTADVVQFLRPNGRRRNMLVDLDLETKDLYEDMKNSNCRFEAEELSTGLVSITISGADEDYDCSLTANGPEVVKGMEDMLRRKKWKAIEYEE